VLPKAQGFPPSPVFWIVFSSKGVGSGFFFPTAPWHALSPSIRLPGRFYSYPGLLTFSSPPLRPCLVFFDPLWTFLGCSPTLTFANFRQFVCWRLGLSSFFWLEPAFWIGDDQWPPFLERSSSRASPCISGLLAAAVNIFPFRRWPFSNIHLIVVWPHHCEVGFPS